MSAPDPHLNHWADHAAERTTRAHPERREITVAAGITPSGVVHIGNFREVITVDLVARALRDRGLQVRFIYSWDDFDVFRKVPADLPDPTAFSEHLGKSIVDVPDPYGRHESYAAHFIDAFQHSLPPLGITPTFIRQHQMYRSGAYAEGIRRALQHRETIRDILNGARSRHGGKNLLAEDWMPLAGFCDACGKDPLGFDWDGDWNVGYQCNACGHRAIVDLRQGGNLKLPWRVDWPMRWAHEKVCFEPGGKDHSSAGSSYDTAKEIVREVYDWQAPVYVGYDFVIPKGQGGKISSSKGGAVTVSDCLEIYEPEVLRWLFASYRPNTEFQVSFDLDVIKVYEDYDRAVRLAHEPDDGGKRDKKRRIARRTLQLADVEHRRIEPSTPPPQLGFRTLSVVLQIFDGDLEGARQYLERTDESMSDLAPDAFGRRASCVWNWIEKYAPDDFRYRIRKQPIVRELSSEHRTLLKALVEKLEAEPNVDDGALGAFLKQLSRETSVPMKDFYPQVYDLLIARDHGPKLSTLLATMGSERALPLLRPSAEHGE